MSPRWLLPALFFSSGASSLVFETLWFRQAGLAVGNGVWASSLVLSGFMAGLGVGNLIAARFGDRVRRALRAYALLECVVAASGVALVFGLPRLAPLLAPLLDPLFDRPAIANAIRFGVAFAALLVPSTAMGATLPLLTRAIHLGPERFGVAFGLLYGSNTLGAVAGPLLAEGALIPAFGIRGSALAAGVATLAIAAAALGLDRSQQATEPAAAAARARHALPWAELAAVFGSGFALLALEVVWFRVLLLFIPGSSFAFALMLSTVLAGIGVGGILASLWLRRRPDAHGAAASVALLAGAGCAACYALFPLVMAPFGRDALTGVGQIAWVGAALTMPTAIASGALFTLVGARLRERLGGDARTAGAAALANTIGSALGSLAAGFLLLPLLGSQHALLALLLVYAVVGLLLRDAATRSGPLLATGAALAAGAASVAVLPIGERFLDVVSARWSGPGATRIAAREGLTETIVYLQMQRDELPGQRLMVTNSYAMSGTGSQARRYMKLYVLWPAAVHPRLESALLISYGVGSTARALADVPSLRRIDVVDISRDILEMSDLLHPDADAHPLRDPRVRVHVEDGRHYLQVRRDRYDLITGEPPPPHVAGVVNLYTREYFAAMRERLNEGGIVTYWLPTHSLDPGQSRAILAAFCDVFADCSLWAGAGHDLMMVGTRDAAGPVSEESFTRAWRDPRLAPELHAIGLERPELLGATFVGDADYLRGSTAGVPPLVDDHPERLWRVTATSRRMPALYGAWMNVAANRERFRASSLVRRLWPARLREATLPYFDVQGVANRGTYRFDVVQRSALEAADLALSRGARGAALWALDGDVDLQRAAAARASEPGAPPAVAFHLGLGALVDGRHEEAIAAFARAADAPAHRQRAELLAAYARCRLGRGETPTPADPGDEAAAWRWLASRCSAIALGADAPATSGTGGDDE